jgi:oxygen-independent coproporphyrinogen-3 oxidase
VRRTGDLPAWRTALAAEVQLVESERLFSIDDRLQTLYVGGGTPSLLGAGAMDALVDVFSPERLAGPELEWTVEANPESFTREVAVGWAAAGVNRLSLGAQSFDDAALRWMGRLHGPSGPERALEAAREAGLNNLSIDLIFGLPAALGRSWDDDLARALELDVPHVSLYGLTIEPDTALGRALREGRAQPVDEEQYRIEFLRAAEVLTDAGYIHYEVSNFARPGAEARHNSVYWDGRPYLGLGNGAHSYAPPVRRWNEREWETYSARVVAGSPAEAAREVVDATAGALERAWLDLRTRKGIPRPLGGSQQDRLVRRWIGQGLAEEVDDRIRLTAEGWLLLDRLAVDFDHASAAG